MADPAKTAKKRTALLPRIVQKTSRYPMAENQAQSTRKSLVRPSTMKEATMTITATAMPLLGISTSLVVRHVHGPVTGVAFAAGSGQKGDDGQSAPPVVNLGRNASPDTVPSAARIGHVILTDGYRLKKRRRDPHPRPADQRAIPPRDAA